MLDAARDVVAHVLGPVYGFGGFLHAESLLRKMRALCFFHGLVQLGEMEVGGMKRGLDYILMALRDGI